MRNSRLAAEKTVGSPEAEPTLYLGPKGLGRSAGKNPYAKKKFPSPRR